MVVVFSIKPLILLARDILMLMCLAKHVGGKWMGWWQGFGVGKLPCHRNTLGLTGLILIRTDGVSHLLFFFTHDSNGFAYAYVLLHSVGFVARD